MATYSVTAYADWDRRLKKKTTTITAESENEAWVKAWMTFPEYKELLVTEVEQDG